MGFMLYPLPNSALVRWTYMKKLSACADLQASLSAISYMYSVPYAYFCTIGGRAFWSSASQAHAGLDPRTSSHSGIW